MSTVLLVRHGLTSMTGPILAGHTPELFLDERGVRQADAVAARIAAIPLTAIVTSPLERCHQTAEAILAAQRAAGHDPQWAVDERIVEVKYGDWTGKAIKDLAKDPLWKVVQAQPSAVQFPNGERMADMQARGVAAIREWDAKLGPDAVWVACSHGDVIKAVLADAYGIHLDMFQRIVADPCSVSVVRYTDTRPFVLRTNDIGGELASLAPPPPKARRRKRPADDATLGGGAGSGSV
ncbi:MAG: Phosphoglycerate mutase [Pseudonocardiales bacterium]|nr:Phosphoglycerate mutase [Jatrophihabitantaceae bacterium]MCW2602070.1 Phosphoglycerate mutase [Pseudonocardiales bacterium]